MDDYLDENSSTIAMVARDEPEIEIAKQEKPPRRFAIGPNLPSFFNCLRRRKNTAQREEYANLARLGARLRNYNDDSESPLWRHKEDNNISELCSIHCQYLCGEITRQRQQAKMAPVAGPSNEKDTGAVTGHVIITRKRKLASRRKWVRHPYNPTEEIFSDSEKTSSASHSSSDSD